MSLFLPCLSRVLFSYTRLRFVSKALHALLCAPVHPRFHGDNIHDAWGGASVKVEHDEKSRGHSYSLREPMLLGCHGAFSFSVRIEEIPSLDRRVHYSLQSFSKGGGSIPFPSWKEQTHHECLQSTHRHTIVRIVSISYHQRRNQHIPAVAFIYDRPLIQPSLLWNTNSKTHKNYSIRYWRAFIFGRPGDQRCHESSRSFSSPRRRELNCFEGLSCRTGPWPSILLVVCSPSTNRHWAGLSSIAHR